MHLRSQLDFLQQKIIQLEQNQNILRETNLNTFPKDSKSDSKDSSTNEQYNSGSNQNKGLNEHNFITLGKISEADKIEIIQLGFQLQSQAKLSLKKYYESVSEANSLFQLKGYSIKYETIRRTKLYQQLK